MFTLAPTPTFKATVTVNVATATGAWKQESFVGEFVRTDEDQREELLKLKNIELVRKVLVGWSMKDEQRNEVPFCEENFEAFLRLTGAVREAVIAYWNHNVGAREKN